MPISGRPDHPKDEEDDDVEAEPKPNREGEVEVYPNTIRVDHAKKNGSAAFGSLPKYPPTKTKPAVPHITIYLAKRRWTFHLRLATSNPVEKNPPLDEDFARRRYPISGLPTKELSNTHIYETKVDY